MNSKRNGGLRRRKGEMSSNEQCQAQPKANEFINAINNIARQQQSRIQNNKAKATQGTTTPRKRTGHLDEHC